MPNLSTPKVLALLNSLEPCPLIRLVFPLKEAERQGLLEARFAHLFSGELTMEQLHRDIDWSDIVVFQRFGTPQHLAILEVCKSLGKRVVFETDDDLLNLPLTNSNYPLFQRPDVRQTLETLIMGADLVTVSTSQLGKEMTPLNSSISLLPNVLPDLLFPEIPNVADLHDTEKIVIGYAGTATHQADLAPVLPALGRLLNAYPNQVSLVFMGCIPSQFEGHPSVTLIAETPNYESFVTMLRQSGIHIGLAPLIDNPFNRSKSAIKWMEYSACGIVAVCSDVGPYREFVCDAVDGVLIDGLSVDVWYQALERLVLEPDYRRQLATQAYETVRKEHMLSTAAHRWASVYRELLNGTVRLQDRRGFNLLTLASDPYFPLVLTAYLSAFTEEDDVALHVLAGNDLDASQGAALRVIGEMGKDPEHIPDVSILDAPQSEYELPEYLRDADLVVGAEGLIAKAQGIGIPAVVASASMDLRRFLRSAEPPASPLTPPRVSIVIPVFNKVEYTRKCLEALSLNTPLEVTYEVIIVDNASTDGTAALLAQLEGDVHVIVNQQNLGFAKACNQGAEVANGQYLLFLNNDTEPLPGWLEPMIEVLEQDPQVGVVGSRLLYPDGTLQHAGVMVAEDRRHGLPLNCLHRFHRLPADHPPANLKEDVQVVTGAALMIRRTLFAEVGGFDERYWNGNEDVDLCFTLAQKGWRIVYQPESCLIHHESVSGEERWSKLNENIRLLLQRWTGKVVPDVLINSDGHQVPHPARLGAVEVEDKISIILLGFNLLAFTKLCVESVLMNSDAPFELILVDNGSVDGTREYFQDLAARDARVKAVLNSRNLGFARGCNQGIALATGGYVLFLNNDTIVPRGWLSRLLAHFKARPAVGAVGTISNRVSGPQELPSVPMANHPDALPEILAFGDEVAARASGQGFELARLVGYCLMVRRDVLDRIGGFDPCFGIGNFEDDDLCLRIRTVGFRTWVAQDVYVHHFGSRTFASLGTAVIVDTLDQGWEAFKQKWELPSHLERNQGYRVDLPAFDPNRHFVPLDRDLDGDQADPFRLGTAPLHLQDRRGVAFFHHPDWASNTWQEVVTAYARAFAPGEDVSLVFWLDPTQGLGLDDASLRLVEALVQAGLDPESVPDLLLVPDVLDLAGLAGLYAAVDCVVVAGDARQAARAEQVGRRILCDLTVDAWREVQKSLVAEVSA